MSYKLYSSISGNGPTIIFLHGFLTSSHYYSRIRKKIDGDFTVVALDLLGHGKSPKPKQLSYTYQDHIDAIHYTLIELGVKPPFIMAGHSMGALLSLRYARNYPGTVRKLLLFNPPMFADATEAEIDIATSAWRYRAFLFSRAQKQLWRAVRLLPKNPLKNRHPVGLTDMLRASNAARNGSLRNVIMKADIFSEVYNVAIPTTIIIGKRDRYVYLQNALQATWPNHVSIRLNKLGHNAIGFHPELGEKYIREEVL